MTDKQNKLIPKLRFPEFKNDGEWEFRRLGDIADSFSGGTPTASKADYYGGDIPFIRSGEVNSPKTSLFLTQAGLDCSAAKMVDKGTILYALYGATSGEVGLARVRGAINQAVLAIIPKEGIEKLFLFQYLRYAKSSIINRFIQGGQGNLSAAILSNLLIPLPSLAEQRKIADLLTSLDDLLAGAKAKREQLIVHKKGLMQKLFPAPGKTLPEYRFPGFVGEKEWEVKCLGDVTTIVNRRNKSRRMLPIYSINNKQGFILQSEQFNGLDSNSRGYDTSQYKIVNSNLFAYNPARINVGSIGYSGRIKEGIISSLYVCFKSTDTVTDDFLRCFFETDQFRRSVDNNVEGGIRSYLFYENFSRINIALPTIDEQKNIAFSILSINELIEQYENKVIVIENHRQGLMQQLFPKNV